jgi:hypothetical protein
MLQGTLFVKTKTRHTDNTEDMDNMVLDGRKAEMLARCRAIRLESRLTTDRRKMLVDIPSRFPLYKIELDTIMLCE